MNFQGGYFQFVLPSPTINLAKVFTQIKTMQKDNLNDIPVEAKDERGEEEIKGLKFIAKKIKILLQKNKRIEYNEASRILINNFANQQKGQRNIKRRVYDAINVLVSAGVIAKDDNKIELIQQKRFNNKTNKNNTKTCKIECDVNKEAIEKKLEILNQRRARLNILKKIFGDKHKQNRKDITTSVQLQQQVHIIPFQKTIENVSFNGKKKINIVIKGGKMLQKPEVMKQILCKLDTQKRK